MVDSPPSGPSIPRGDPPGPATVAVFNALYWPYLLSTVPMAFVPAFLCWALGRPFDKKRRWLHRYTSYWGGHYLELAPFAGVTVQGRERVEGVGPVIYVVNHQSMVDILALFATRLDYLWVSKVENFWVPFLGWNMSLNNYVKLKRGHLPSIMRMYRTCLRRIEEGHSLCIFPEGTRSPDREIQEFYPGAFRLAVRNRIPVVPILIDGTGEVLPKSSFHITPRHVTIRVLDPIDPSTTGYDHRRLSDVVRARMIEELDVMRGRAKAAPVAQQAVSSR